MHENSAKGPLLATMYPNRTPPIAQWELTSEGKMRGLVVHWDGVLTMPQDGKPRHAIVSPSARLDEETEKTETVVVRFTQHPV